MKLKLRGTIRYEGFALPTVLIASVVMLIVLLSAVGASTSVRSALDSQYYNQIAREAVESGLTLATECLRINSSPGWTDASPLRPGSSCNGSGTESGYVIDTPTMKTSFTVGSYSVDADGRATISAKGIVSLRRTSTPTESVRTFEQTTRRFIQVVPLVTSMAGNAFHTCVVASKQVFCWGSNSAGQLGDQTLIDHATPQPIKYVNGLQAGTIIDVGVGNYFSCARAWSGGIRKLFCWGDNSYGQLGDNTTTNRTGPVPVAGLLTGLDIQDFSVGANGACAIAGSRTFCWGWNPDGQIGNGDATGAIQKLPVKIIGGTLGTQNVVDVATDNYHTCVVAIDPAYANPPLPDTREVHQRTYCWGRNTSGQLGNGTTTSSLVPVQLSGTGVTDVEIGSLHTCILTYNGKMWCTGFNGEGALGYGDTATRLSIGPAETGAMGTNPITSMSLGGYQTCAVAASKVYCWGRNTDGPGQVGNNTSTNQLSPVAVTATGVLSGKTITTVAASGQYTCAFDTASVAYCWGRNDFGQLGDGTTTARLTPVKVNTGLFKPVYMDF
jgi:alpha-tubulin suppressor-like RCC1 family protein